MVCTVVCLSEGAAGIIIQLEQDQQVVGWVGWWGEVRWLKGPTAEQADITVNVLVCYTQKLGSWLALEANWEGMGGHEKRLNFNNSPIAMLKLV